MFKLMEKHGFHQDQFSYVKKRGRIYVKTGDPSILFGYLRKKHTHLNPVTKQWEHGSSFKVQVNNTKEVEKNTWDEVLVEFENWLRSLDKQMSK